MAQTLWNSTMQLRVELRHIAPRIWRRLVVPAECTLDVLHDILQIAFGWTSSHLHRFEVGTVHFELADVPSEWLTIDERHAPLGAVASKGDTFIYEYDFGDSWHHDVLVEAVDQDAIDVRVACLDGERAGPPEDCGGPPGYENLVLALANSDHPERAELRRWVGRVGNPPPATAYGATRMVRLVAVSASPSSSASRPPGEAKKGAACLNRKRMWTSEPTSGPRASVAHEVRSNVD